MPADVSSEYFSANKETDLEVKCHFVSVSHVRVCAAAFALTVAG